MRASQLKDSLDYLAHTGRKKGFRNHCGILEMLYIAGCVPPSPSTYYRLLLHWGCGTSHSLVRLAGSRTKFRILW